MNDFIDVFDDDFHISTGNECSGAALTQKTMQKGTFFDNIDQTPFLVFFLQYFHYYLYFVAVEIAITYLFEADFELF